MAISVLKSYYATYLVSISRRSRNWELCKRAFFNVLFPASFAASRISTFCSLPFAFLSFSLVRRKKSSIQRRLFVPGHRKGQNFAHRWAGSRLIPRVKMEVSGDPLLPSRERWKFRSSSRLGRTEGDCGRYFRSRVTYYRTGRTLCEFRQPDSRAEGRGAGDARGFARGASFTLRIFPRRLRRVRETLRRPSFFFLTTARVRTCQYFYNSLYARYTDTIPGDGFRFSFARRKQICTTKTHVSKRANGASHCREPENGTLWELFVK